MRLLILFSLICFYGHSTLWAQNLVPNPSFEEYITCPDWISQLDRAENWFPARISPDYHNACDNSGSVSVPSSTWGDYQIAKQGVAYAGFNHSSNDSTFKEAIGVELIAPMEIGIPYYVSFYLSRTQYGGAALSGNCWANGQGIRFSTSEFLALTEEDVPVDNLVHVYANTLVSDTSNWVHVEGWYTPDSSYTYLYLGNFFKDDFFEMECDMDYSVYKTYYFVDCVCVSSEQFDCDDIVSLEEGVRPNHKVQVWFNTHNIRSR